jgi:hypothetical protein
MLGKSQTPATLIFKFAIGLERSPQATLLLDSVGVRFQAGFFPFQVFQSHMQRFFDFCSLTAQTIAF